MAEFDGLKLTAWVATACEKGASDSLYFLLIFFDSDFLTNAGLMLAVAQLLPIVSVKVAYLASLLLFETGSVLCGAVRVVRSIHGENIDPSLIRRLLWVS